MKLSSCLVRNLTPEQYRQVYSLNLRKRGFSRGHLRTCFRESHAYSRIVLATERSQLVGWALMVQCLNDDGSLREFSTNLYVRRFMRRSGVGTKLMGWVGRFLDQTKWQAHVCIWSPASEGFYRAIGHPRVRIIVSPRYQTAQ